MAKIAGRWVKIEIDDSAAAPQDVSSDLTSVTIPKEYAELDMTGFLDGSDNSVPGMPSSPVEVTGDFNPVATVGLYTVLSGIVGVAAGKTLTIAIGANATPTTGDPEFEGEFYCQKMNISATPKGKVQINASFRPYGSTAPAWGVVS